MLEAKRVKIPDRFPAAALDIMNFGIRVFADQQVHYIVEFEGRLNERLASKAAKLLTYAEPVLGCRFVSNTRRPFWQKRDDLEETDIFSIIRSKKNSDIRDFITMPVDPYTDPQVQLRIFRSSNDILCLKADHAAADAAGAKDILYLFVKLYNALNDNPNYIPVPNLKGRRSMNQVIENIPLKKRISLFRQRENMSSPWGFPVENPGNTDGRDIDIRFINSVQLNKIKEYGRKNKATLNDMLLTALFRSMLKMNNSESDEYPLKVMLPIDLRRYISSNKAEAVCNLSGSVYPELIPVENESFTGTLKRVKKQMNIYKSSYPGLGGMIYMSMLINFVTRTIGSKKIFSIMQNMHKLSVTYGKSSPNLSNFGIINSELLNFHDVKVINSYGTGPVMFGPGFMLAVSGYSGRLTLSSSYCSACVNRVHIKQFLDSVILELTSVME
ncbi:MAG: hypothetical protein JW864_17930 [Spirochaetes bacterium]|nr:hypothetical protein [Spirochaetota bacterium]